MAHDHNHEGHSHGDHEGHDHGDLSQYDELSKKAKELMAYARSVTKPDAKIIDVCEKIEKKTIELGAKPAFPVNVSLDHEAAHSTAKIGDERVIGNTLAKIDFGLHIDGWIIDTAFTADFTGEHGKLLETAELALANALSKAKAGVNVRELGKEISETILKKGFKPVENLCGHSLEQYGLHAGRELPNTPTGSYVLQEGDVFAIEPFVSTGIGHVNDGELCEIYSLYSNARARMPASKKLLEKVQEDYLTLPFAKRWVADVPSLGLALHELQRNGFIEAYPVLQERPGAFISQAETTMIVEKNGVRPLV